MSDDMKLTDIFPAGGRVRFTHMWPESPTSRHLDAYSGQICTVTGQADHDGFGSRADREEAALYVVYRVRFDDGHKDCAFEYELADPVCRHCGLDVMFGNPHADADGGGFPEGVWFHIEHGGITCGSLSDATNAEPEAAAQEERR